MTHISSLPLCLAAATSNKNGRGGDKAAASSSSNRVVRWSGGRDGAAGEEDDDAAGAGASSSYRFRRTFQPEEEEEEEEDGAPPADGRRSPSPRVRYAPQALPIQISIMRSGRMFRLGTATVLLAGEEDGRASVNVPIVGCNHAPTRPSPPSSSTTRWPIFQGARDLDDNGRPRRRIRPTVMAMWERVALYSRSW